MTIEQIVIRRCTREGRILWPHVARQLGISEPTARARHDPTYMRPYQPVVVPALPEPPEPVRCGATRIPDLADRIIAAIGSGPTVLSVIVDRVGSPRSTIVTRLTDMKARGLIRHIKEKRAWGPAKGRGE